MKLLPYTAEFFYRTGKEEKLASRCRECESARKREYRSRNLELVRSQERSLYSKETDKDRERNRKYNSKYPEKAAARRRARRARLQNGFTQHYTVDDVLREYGILCYLCKKEIDLYAPRRPGILGWENGLHVDHVIPIISGGADSLENVRPSHGKCNLIKGTKILIPDLR